MEILKELGIHHFNIFLPAHALSAVAKEHELHEICDYSDRNYCTALNRTRVTLGKHPHGKSLESYQGPVYPTKAEKHIFADLFHYDFCCISNLSLVSEVDRNYNFTRSLFVLPSNYEAAGYEFA